MGFSLPKIHLPSTLSKVAEKPNLAKLLPVLAVVNPVGYVAYQAVAHPDQVKSTISNIGKEVKKDAGAAASTLGKGAKAVGGVAKGAFNTIMMPLMVVGGLAVILMVLKK